MGTPDFAVPCLQSLLDAGHEVCAVFTQPDKPKGRGYAMTPPPVKVLAMEHDIPVYQPKTLRTPEAAQQIREMQPDCIVVVAYGKILPKEILEIPPHGCINVHASLLPKYRGAAPIQWSIIEGETVTGVTTMQMDEGLDTGDMIMKKEVSITEDETGESLHDKLAEAGAKLCVETLTALENKTAKFEKQGESPTAYAKMLTKDLGNINWNEPAVRIERLVRGLNSWPSAYTHWNGKVLKIWKAKAEGNGSGEAAPGTVTAVGKTDLTVQTGDGVLRVLEVQLPGKKRMDTGAFLRGNKVEPGVLFTEG